MKVEEYQEVKSAAGKCEICRQFPAVVAFEKRGKRGRIIERVEICKHCAILDPRREWQQAGAANSAYAANEMAKLQLVRLIDNAIDDKSFADSLCILHRMFRRKKRLPKRIEHIKRKLEEQLSVFGMQVAAEPEPDQKNESMIERAIFGYSDVVTAWLVVIACSMFGWCLIFQLIRWFGR